jgi:pyruvate dehydrogenase E1 component alpha subunit
MEAKELIAFEEEIGELFNQGKIRSPIHLSKNNEEQLIEIFKEIQPNDYVFSTHRSHLHALLKDISPEWLKQEILNNHSISINNKEHRFFSSAIVGGICPISLGVAMAIKRQGGQERVWAFCGEMASRTGIFYECVRYAEGFDLPITYVVEDNGKSVNTPTTEVWGLDYKGDKIRYYKYVRTKYPHSGTGKWIEF